MGGAVLLRADADASIGVGHVMRCLALAQALTDAGGRAIFASTALPDSISRRLEHEHLPVRMICAQPGSASEAEATARVAREEMAGRIVVDGYHLGPDYLAGLHRHGLRVAVIDDHAIACAPYAAVTLNQNIFAPPARPAEGYLSGLRYALLRRELRADVTTPRTGHSRRILITLGGADPDRMTELAIAACASIASSLTAADVVIGGANPRAEAIEHAVAAHASWARAHRRAEPRAIPRSVRRGDRRSRRHDVGGDALGRAHDYDPSRPGAEAQHRCAHGSRHGDC
jgi:spore coat polysaccharide biosynthesis predicted glycosyltransferase SpsG